MPLKGIAVSTESLYRLLQDCRSLAAGRQVQELIAENGFANDLFLASHLIRMFTFFKSLCDAKQVFSKLASPSAFVWSAIISAHTHLGQAHQAIDLYYQMQLQPNAIPNEFVFVSVLKACVKTIDLRHGKLIHTHVLESGLESKIIVINTLIDFYAKCGALEDACNIFVNAISRDVVTWNVMIGGYSHNKHIEGAVLLFEQMQENGLEPNHVTWNALIGGYAQDGKGAVSLMFFEKMQMQGTHPGQATYVSIVQVCSSMASLERAKIVHVQILESIFKMDFVIGSSLIDMYVKFGNLECARCVFNSLKEKDVVTWNAMIAGYAQHGHGHLAFQLFLQMQDVDIRPDNFTFVSIVKACTSIAAVEQGKEIHSLVIENGLGSDVYIGSALIDMYCKWHSLEDGCRVFKTLPQLNIVTWNAMLSGYAQHRTFKEALMLFELIKSKGFTPDSVTFVSLLSACSHEGLVDEAFHRLESMKTAHGIEPSLDHYDCMLDILGRAGHLNEALQFQRTTPYSPQDTGWRSLLNHCLTHGSIELGKQCFEKVTNLDEKDSASYVLMSQLCAATGKWEDAVKLEEQRKSVGAQKKPGMAFIEIGNQVHQFLVGDVNYPAVGKPSLKIKRLKGQMLQTGYMPTLDLVLQLALA